jgi:hypothetical protein
MNTVSGFLARAPLRSFSMPADNMSLSPFANKSLATRDRVKSP